MKVLVTQLKSTIKREQSQKATIKALGLGKVSKSVEHEVNSQVLGMLKKVSHLVRIEEV